MKRFTLAIPIAAMLLAANAQTGPVKLEFEVASIKVAPPLDPRGFRIGASGGPGAKDPILYSCQNMTLASLLTLAYDIQSFQLSAPAWANDTRFTLSAKVPSGATKPQLREMLQNFLTERFQLKAHFEKKEMPVFELTLGKNGPKFKPAVEEPPGTPVSADAAATGPRTMKFDEAGFPVLDRPGFIGQGNKVRMWLPKSTIADFGRQISGELGRFVVDGTGLKGEFDIRMYWVQDSAAHDRAMGMPVAPASESELGPTLLAAIQEQLGLKLESKKSAIDMLVIDRAEKMPVEN